MPSGEHRNRRAAKLSQAQAELVIRYCRTPQDDPFFARALGVSENCCKSYRLGYAGWVIRQRVKATEGDG